MQFPGNAEYILLTSVPPPQLGPLANERAVSSDDALGKICISYFLFYCEGMLSLVVLWLCE